MLKCVWSLERSANRLQPTELPSPLPTNTQRSHGLHFFLEQRESFSSWNRCLLLEGGRERGERGGRREGGGSSLVYMRGPRAPTLTDPWSRQVENSPLRFWISWGIVPSHALVSELPGEKRAGQCGACRAAAAPQPQPHHTGILGWYWGLNTTTPTDSKLQQWTTQDYRSLLQDSFTSRGVS